MSEQDLAWEKFRQALSNSGKTVEMAKRWHAMAQKGSTQTQKLRKLCNTLRKS